jgi:hypothetical protein
VSVTAQTDPDFVFKPIPEIAEPPEAAAAQAHPASRLGPLEQLAGTWKGEGFNAIWRPHKLSTGQDRFLELNLTNETLKFTKINGPIPNRGLLMHDINMFGLTYMQQIAEKASGAGLHIEPGIWAHVPPTSAPKEPSTVVRMASIPHGTTILAQGTSKTLNGGPEIHDNNILPFAIGSPTPHNNQFGAIEGTFTELNLSVPTAFRHKSAGVTQQMVKNPNSVLQDAIAGKNVTHTVALHVTTLHAPVRGGGTANTAFLAAGANPPGGNANAVQVQATFWIETVAGQAKPQLQYTQLVELDFNGLRWPHVTVATLHKQ